MPEFYGQLPASPWARKAKQFPDHAKVVFGSLCILARGSKTWVHAAIEAIAAACGKSVPATRRGLRILTKLGLIEWEEIGENFRFLFRLRNSSEPTTPAPKLAATPPVESPVVPPVKPPVAPMTATTSDPHKEDRARAAHASGEEREKKEEEREGSSSSDESQEKETTEASVHEPDYNPNAPLTECADQVAEDELVDDLFRRAKDLCYVASRTEIVEALRGFSEIEIDAALSYCEALPTPPRDFRYVRKIMANWRERGSEIAPPKGRSERIPATATMQNHNPRTERLEPGIPGATDYSGSWREMFAGMRGEGSPTAQKEPAADPTSQVTPRPAGDSSVRSRPDYTVNMDSRQPDGRQRSGQDAPRASNPRPAPRRAPNLRTLSTISFPLPLSDSPEADPVPKSDQSRPLRC